MITERDIERWKKDTLEVFDKLGIFPRGVLEEGEKIKPVLWEESPYLEKIEQSTLSQSVPSSTFNTENYSTFGKITVQDASYYDKVFGDVTYIPYAERYGDRVIMFYIYKKNVFENASTFIKFLELKNFSPLMIIRISKNIELIGEDNFREYMNQSGMDHEFAHLLAFLCGDDYKEDRACEIQMRVARYRGESDENWNIVAYEILPSFLLAHKYYIPQKY